MGTATWNTRRIHVIYVDYVDEENSTWNTRWFYVEKWSAGGQIRFNVESTSIQRRNSPNNLQGGFLRRIGVDSTSKKYLSGHGIYSSSNQRRFYVEEYLCRHCLFSTWFNVDSTLKFPYPQGLSIHQRRIYVDSTSMLHPRYSSIFNVECTSIQRWYFPINRTCRFFNVE